jgi:hypothetical protein
MSCTLATLAACFSLGGIYVDTGLSYQDVGERRFNYDLELLPDHADVTWWSDDSPQNPYGRLALGYQIEVQTMRSKVVLSLEASHISSIESHTDQGVNGITLGARYFPFARQ